MHRFLLSILLSVVVLVTFAGTASAEAVTGRMKTLAGELQLFTLSTAQEKVLLLSWDDRTIWKGISHSIDLKPDEILSVDVRLEKDRYLADAVSRIKTPLPAGIQVTSIENLAEYLNDRERFSSLTLVDTRAVELYDAGHIPGAVSLPLSKLEKRTAGLLPENKEAKLVFYDEGQGGNSAGKAAEISTRAGYRDSTVLQEGAAGWADSGKTLASSTAFIRKTAPVVIDVRSRVQVAEGHIEKAVNYPLTALKDYFGYLPANKLTPIVLYAGSDKDAGSAAGIIRTRGYRKVTIYPGGTASWEKNAEVLESGPAGEEISSSATTHGGELDTKDFEMALASPVMVEIVDVRSAADHKKGKFPNSKQIALQDLTKRHEELNRDKIQVIFAADPKRAEMAYDYLKSKGYRVNYLNGAVEFEKDGKYTLKEK